MSARRTWCQRPDRKQGDKPRQCWPRRTGDVARSPRECQSQSFGRRQLAESGAGHPNLHPAVAYAGFPRDRPERPPRAGLFEPQRFLDLIWQLVLFHVIKTSWGNIRCRATSKNFRWHLARIQVAQTEKHRGFTRGRAAIARRSWSVQNAADATRPRTADPVGDRRSPPTLAGFCGPNCVKAVVFGGSRSRPALAVRPCAGTVICIDVST